MKLTNVFDDLQMYFNWKQGKITDEEYFNKVSIMQKLLIDYNKEKIKGTIYFEEII